ncbi:hypothetical protein AHiyo4_34890 [Arthrobacter sp. Hiyo4]|nr:hypothetical protein AHiyo4_34890 [Arthrobacter sp. Hiyo4]
MDTGHTVVTQGRLTRELLYVSMTRGKVGNRAYVSENDPLDDEPMDPALRASWRQILGEVLAAEGAERTAHEIREAEQSREDSLENLSVEYDYLAQIASSEDLAQFLDANPDFSSDGGRCAGAGFCRPGGLNPIWGVTERPGVAARGAGFH